MRKSRMIAIILSLVMIIASLPLPALAEETVAPEQIATTADTVAAPQDMTEQPVAEAAADGSIEAGATVEFKNTGGTPQNVTLKSTYIYSLSYVIYYADDTIESHSFLGGNSSQTITVPARGRAVVTAESGASYSYTSAAITAAAVDEPVYTHIGLLTGESRRFKNTSNAPASLIFKWNNWYFCDYVLYDAAGNYSSSKTPYSDSSLSVPAGYTAEITSRENYMEIGALNGVFTVEQTDSTALNVIYGRPNESYSITNMTNSTQSISGIYGVWVIYNASGEVDSIYQGDNRSIEIKPGYRVEALLLQPYTFNYSPACLKIEKLDKPAATVISAEAGDSYSIENTTDNAYPIYGGHDSFIAYALCDAGGGVSSQSASMQFSNGDVLRYISVPAHYTLKLTAQTYSEIYAVNAVFKVTKDEEPIFDERTYAHGDSYIYKNKTGEEKDLLYTSINDGAHCAIYNAAGEWLKMDSIYGCSTNNIISVPAGGYAKISQNRGFENSSKSNSNIRVYAPKGCFDISESETPVFRETYVRPGQTYSFKNISSDGARVKYYGAYKLYDELGQLVKSGSSWRSTQTSNDKDGLVPAGYTLEIAPDGSSDYEVYSYYDDFAITHKSAAAYTEFVADKSYKITNNGTADYTLPNYGSFDYILYGENNTFIGHAADHNSSITIPVNGYALVTPHVTFAVSAADAISVTETEPIYKISHVAAKSTSVFKNTSSYNVDVYIDKMPNSDYQYDYVIYGDDGTISQCAARSDAESLTIPANCSLIITAAGYQPGTNLHVTYPLSFISETEGESEAYYREFLSPGESVKIKNIMTKSASVYFTMADKWGIDRAADYVVYNANGTYASGEHDFNVYSEQEISVPAGAEATITALSDVEVHCVGDSFETSASQSPAYEYHRAGKGETLVITNNNVRAADALITSRKYDMTVYDGDGKVKSCSADNDGSSITIEAFESVAVTPLLGPIDVMLGKGMTVEKRDNPALFKSVAQANEHMSIKNAYSESLNLMMRCVDTKYVTYKISDSGGSVVKEGAEVWADKSTFNIPAGGSIDVDFLSGSVVAFGPYEMTNGDVPPTATIEPDPTSTPKPTATATPKPTLAPTKAPANITGIRIKANPSKTTVVEGTALDTSGLKVEAVYSDGKAEEITDYTLTGYDMNSVSPQTITVEYMGFTTSFNITVAAKSMIGIVITQKPDKRTYTQGESLDTAGMIVTAMYNNGTSEEIGGYNVSGYDPDYVGNQTISVNYNGYSAAFSVTVSAKSEITGTVETPKLSINSFIGGKTVTLTCATDGASIYYTTDGSAPDENPELYSEPITLTETATIKAVAVKSGMNPSKTAGGKITVGNTADPISSRASGRVEVGTVITLRSETSGSMIYYTTDGSEPTTESKRYSGGIAITDDVTIKAIAVKDGYKNSGIFEASYTVPKIEPGSAAISVGSVSGAAGDTLSIPVYLFMDGESGITDYRFTLNYDASKFEYQSVTPAEGALASDLFTSASGGAVTVLYSGAAIESGEVCNINLKALESDEDGEYPISIAKDGVKIETESGNKFNIEITDGAITLIGSVNSNLELKSDVMLTDSSGNDITDKGSVKGEVTANVTLENANEDAALEPTTVNIIMAVYDREGSLVNISVMDADLSDLNYVFTNTVDIPEGVEVGSIKLMVWNGLSDMTPMTAASEIL